MDSREDHKTNLNGIFEEREAKKHMYEIFDSAEEHSEITIITKEGEPAAAVVPLSLLEEKISQKELCNLIYKIKLLVKYNNDKSCLRKKIKLGKNYKNKSITFEELEKIIDENIEEETKTKDSVEFRNQLFHKYSENLT